MKRVKKVLICAAVCATACSFAVLTACTNNQPSDGLSADVKVAESMSSEQLNTQIAKIEGTSATAFTAEGGIKITKLLGGALGDKAVTVAELSAKGNFADGGAADIKMKLNAQLFGEEGTTPASGLMDYNVYMRGFENVFYMTEPAAETYEYGSLSESVSGVTSVTDIFTAALGEGLSGDYAMLLKLANVTDAIVVDETAHTVTLNINRMVYGLYGQIKQIVNNITLDTTISGLMKCSAVKYYINAYAGDMTAQDLYDTIIQTIVGAGGTTPFADVAEGSPLAAILPLQNEGVYDYIVRLLNSQDVATLLGVEKPLGETKLSESMGEDAAAALKALKDSVNALDGTVISKNKITIPSQDGTESAAAGASVSDLSLKFAFDGQQGLKTVDLSGIIGANLDGEVEMELNLTIDLSAQQVSDFDDIDAYTVNIRDEYGAVLGTTTIGAIIAPDVSQS